MGSLHPLFPLICSDDELASKSYLNSTSHQQSTPVVRKLSMNYNHLEGLFNCSLLGPTPRVSDLVGLEGDPGIYIFNKFPGNAYAARPEATLRDPCSIPFFASLQLPLHQVTFLISSKKILCSRQINTTAESILKI